MSHYTVAVITPLLSGEVDAQSLVDQVVRLMAPYDENTEVEPYDRPCYCIKDEVPNPDCEQCDGKGKYQTSYNPKSKWDYYLEGGRWNGAWHGSNRSVVSDIPAGWSPYAAVTPDGEWHAVGRMGWFAISFDRKPDEEWIAEWERIREHYRDHQAVLLDCHI